MDKHGLIKPDKLNGPYDEMLKEFINLIGERTLFEIVECILKRLHPYCYKVSLEMKIGGQLISYEK